MDKNEKQMEAKRLYQELPTFNFKEKKMDINGYKRPNLFLLCMVNGVRYMRTADKYRLTEFVSKGLKIGTISKDDILVGRNGKVDGVSKRNVSGRQCILVKESTFCGFAEEFKKTISYGYDTREFDVFVESLQQLEDDDYYKMEMSQEDIRKMWETCEKRQRLINEGTRERRAEKEKEEYEEWMRENGIAEELPKDVVADLVNRIEALGWHVTLTRKEGV